MSRVVDFQVNAADVIDGDPRAGQAVRLKVRVHGECGDWFETWMEPNEAEDFARHVFIAARTARGNTDIRRGPHE